MKKTGFIVLAVVLLGIFSCFGGYCPQRPKTGEFSPVQKTAPNATMYRKFMMNWSFQFTAI